MEKIDDAAVTLHTQPWTIVAVLVGVSIVLIGICVCCIRRCCRKRRGKDGKKGIKGVDLKSVQLLGSAYKEKVNKYFRSVGVTLALIYIPIDMEYLTGAA